MQKVEVPGSNYEVIMAVVEIPAATDSGRHTHPGTEIGMVLEGDPTFLVDGHQPKAGDSFEVAAGVIHAAKTGDKAVKALVVYVVERGKPMTAPAN